MSGSSYGVTSATQAQWNATTVPVALDQLVLESDTGRFKIGDGVTLYPGLAYVTQTFAGVNISSATILAAGTNTLQTLANVGIRIALLSLFGGISDGVTDNSVAQPGYTISPLQMMNNYLNSINNSPLEIEFAGKIFATSQTWNVPSNCCPVNGELKAIASSSWTSGLTSSVVPVMNISGYNIAPRNFIVDCNFQAYWALLVTASAGFSPKNLILRRWAAVNPINDLYQSGGILIANGKVTGGEVVAYQYNTSDAGYQTPWLWSGYGAAFVGCADCHPDTWTLSNCAMPLYVDETTWACKFTNFHPFVASFNNNGQVVQNAVLADIRGYVLEFTGFEWDSGAVLINIDANSKPNSNGFPRMVFSDSHWIDGAYQCTFPGYIRVRTTQADTFLDGLHFSGVQSTKEVTKPWLWLESYGAQTATAIATGQTNTTALALNSATGTIAIGNLVQGWGIPADITIISGSGLSWVLSNACTIVAGQFLTFNALTGAFDSSINVAGIQSVVSRTGQSGMPSMNGLLDNKIGNIDFQGVFYVGGNIENVNSQPNTYTAQQTDSGSTMFFTNSNWVLTLPNNLIQGTKFFVMTNASTGGTIVTATGAQIGGATSQTFYVQSKAIVYVEVMNNSTGTNADYVILGNGNSVNPAAPVPITPGASPYSYQATAYGTIVQTGGTGSATFQRPGSSAITLPSINLVMALSPGDKITSTYTVAPTITFIAT